MVHQRWPCGTCGGLTRGFEPNTKVHCSRPRSTNTWASCTVPCPPLSTPPACDPPPCNVTVNQALDCTENEWKQLLLFFGSNHNALAQSAHCTVLKEAYQNQTSELSNSTMAAQRTVVAGLTRGEN